MGNAALSRSGNTSPLGKFTAEFPKFKGPEETHEGAERLAREAGLTLAEWLRTLVMIRVHGMDTVEKLHAERLRVVAGTGEESGEHAGQEAQG